MSPHRLQNSPPWANLLIRLFRFGIYACAGLAGVGVLVASTPSTGKLFPHIVSVAMGITLLVFGLLCLVGTSLQKWVLEWVALWFLSGAILVYTVALWTAATGQLTRLAGASAISMLLLFMLIRCIELSVYWLQNVRVAQLKQAVLSDDE